MQTLHFNTSVDFRHWLEKNHTESDGIWLRISKKDSHEKSLTYAEALDQALCYGWIDGQKKPFDKLSWLQKFTPRRPKSGWSKINTQHVERLIKAAEMTPAGMEAVEAAKADGRWDMHNADRMGRSCRSCGTGEQKMRVWKVLEWQ